MSERRAKCLLVEDEIVIGLATSLALEEAGFDVVGPISDLADAVKAATEGDFQIALLDIAINGGDVFAAADILAEREIPFVFHSGHGERIELRTGYREAIILRKPTSPDELLSVVRERAKSAV